MTILIEFPAMIQRPTRRTIAARRFTVRTLSSLALVAGLTKPAEAQTTYTWNDTNSNWTNSGSWTPVGPDWTLGTSFTTSIANFGNLTVVGNAPNFGNSQIYANGVVMDNSAGASWTIYGNAGILALGTSGINLSGGNVATIFGNVAISANQSWTVSNTTTLRLFAPLHGSKALTKDGDGNLVLAGGSLFFGGINIAAGKMQAGSSLNASAMRELRSNTVTLGAGTLLTTGGFLNDLFSLGAIAGSGTLHPATTGGINIYALESKTFSGPIITGGTLNVRGVDGITQTFDGNLALQTGSLGVNNGATVVLSGTGNASGVAGMNGVITRGGTFTLDNSAGVTTRSGGRLPDAAQVVMIGGTFRLIGHATDDASEAVGLLTLGNGSARISVQNNGAANGTQLTFSNANISLRTTNSLTVNFLGTGGTLGSSGSNPRITFSGPINKNTTNGMLALTNGVAAPAIGWARVNDTFWAGTDSNNNIIALADTARNSSDLASAGGNELVAFAPSSTTTTLAGNLGIAALKISPTGAGQSLDLGTNSVVLNTNAILLEGTSNFTIDGGRLGRFGTDNELSRYIYVTDANAVLTMTGNLAGQPNSLVKSGAGILELSSGSTQLPYVFTTTLTVAEGVLRATPAALGGAGVAQGSNVAIQIRGGVLELSGGGTFTRALTTFGNSSGGAINFAGPGGTNRGDGGFSAYGGNMAVTLTTAVGNSTPVTLTWNNGSSGSFLVDGYSFLLSSSSATSRIEITNPIALDDGNVLNPYYAREFRVANNTTSSSDYALLSGNITGSTSADLVKTGPGKLELTGNNTYAGNTFVYEGTLTVNGQTGNQSGTGSGAVKIFSGAKLTGTGQILPNRGSTAANLLVIEGTYAPGNSVGTMTLGTPGNPITVQLSGIYDFELGNVGMTAPLNSGNSSPGIPNSNHDAIIVYGSLDLTGSTVNIASVGSTGFDNSLTYSWTIATTNGGTLTGLPSLGTISGSDFSDTNFGIFFLSASSSDLYLNFQPVPEPTTILAFGAAGLGLVGFIRRKRRAMGQQPVGGI